jgi:hypothetical protein
VLHLSVALRKELFQAAIYFGTAGSVMLGTLHLDLYIAATTALVGFLVKKHKQSIRCCKPA